MINTPPVPSPYDVVGVIAFAGALLFSNPIAAHLAAPYAVIFFSGLVGTLWALARRPVDTPRSRIYGAVFMLRVIGLAMIITMPLAAWAAPKLGFAEDRYLVAPIAAIIGAVGDDWRPFLIWCRDFMMRWRSSAPPPE